MLHLQEQLNYIYLQEDLKTSAEEIVGDPNIDTSTKPSTIEVTKLLKKVPNLDLTQIKNQASKNPNFKKYYQIALDKLGDEANNPIGDALAVLYATSKSVIDGSGDSTTKNKLVKYLDKLFDTLLNHPGRIATKGFKIWIASFLMLFVFWWLPSAKEILKTARQLAYVMIMVGLVFAIIKFFMTKILRK